MGHALPNDCSPLLPSWDLTYTRLARQALQQLERHVRPLTTRFESRGLACQSQVRATPRGMSMFLAVIGRSGLLFILDYTLVDGMAVARQHGAALDLRLLGSGGEAIASLSGPARQGHSGFHTSFEQVMAALDDALDANAVFAKVAMLFDLSVESPRLPRPR